jgi:hypothetical protein
MTGLKTADSHFITGVEMKRQVWAQWTTLLLALAGCSSDSPWLDPVQGEAPLFSASAEAGPISAIGLRSRTATLDTDLFSPMLSPLQSPPQTLEFNLFEDVTVQVTATGWAHQSSGSFSYQGVVTGAPDQDITLVSHNGVITGNIHTEAGEYQIRSLGGRLLSLEEVDLSLLPEDYEAPLDRLDSEEDSEDAEDTHTMATDGTGAIIDVLVVYTAAARDGAGSTAAIESEIALAVAETNSGYTGSGVTHRIRLADAAMTDWDETEESFDFYTTLLKATYTTDDVMNDIHTLRDAAGADEVVLIVEGDNSYCGIAWLMTSASPTFADSAFSVVARGCATGNYTFAHELGHNMGSNHDHDNGDLGATETSYGLQVPDAGVRTLMAYGCPTTYCRRINRWSNPNASHKGFPLGVAGDGTDAADNRSSLNFTASVVAAFRDAPDSSAGLAPALIAPAPNSQLTGPFADFVLTEVGAEQMALTLGSSLGGAELGQYDLGTRTTQTVSGLPEDGSLLFVRAWARHGTNWVYTDHQLITHQRESVVSETPSMLSPAIGSTLPGETVTFRWTESNAEQVVLRLGRTPSDASLGQYAITTATSLTVRHLPTDGEPIWLTLYALIDGEWLKEEATFNTMRTE